MDREILYTSQQLNDATLLRMQKSALFGLAKLAEAALGSGTSVFGLGCVPTDPAGLQVKVEPGQIYQLANADATAFGVLASDSTQILKQGLLAASVNLSCPAPGTVGQSINYLVQVKFLDVDSDDQPVGFYNSANPSQPLYTSYPTLRSGQCVVTIKSGTSAATGTQVTPSPDAGNVGLYAVTVAYGQTTVTATNILRLGTAPFIPMISHVRQNYVINGAFDFWERATSQVTSGYGSDDRWVNYHNVSTKTHSQQAFTVGQSVVPGNPQFYSSTVVTSVAGAASYVSKEHHIEDVRTLSGTNAVLSFWAKADGSKNMAVSFRQTFGSGGSTSPGTFGVTTIPLTNTWQFFQVPVSIPSIVGKTLGSGHYLQFTFWFDAGSSYNTATNSLGQQSGTFDIANVKLEEGSVATPFSRAGGSIPGELQLCQRYFEKVRMSFIEIYNTTTMYFSGTHKVKKRSSTVSMTGPASASFGNLSGSVSVNCSNYSSLSDDKGISGSCTIAVTSGSVAAGQVALGGAYAGADVSVDCEI